MKQMDERVASAMQEAERLARDHLRKHGAAAHVAAPVVVPAGEPSPAPSPERRACLSCGVSNEMDAAFCKQCGSAMNAGKGSDATV
jgi:hypothetical protein